MKLLKYTLLCLIGRTVVLRRLGHLETVAVAAGSPVRAPVTVHLELEDHLVVLRAVRVPPTLSRAVDAGLSALAAELEEWAEQVASVAGEAASSSVASMTTSGGAG